MKLDARPDTPAELTDTLNALIEAYEEGTIQGLAVATVIAGYVPDYAVVTRSNGAQAIMTSIIGAMFMDQQLGVMRGIKANREMQAEAAKKPRGRLLGPNGEEMN